MLEQYKIISKTVIQLQNIAFLFDLSSKIYGIKNIHYNSVSEFQNFKF